MSRPSYPIFLDIVDRSCVIIGGGAVAVRKAQSLIRAGARRVCMIAPMFANGVPATVKSVLEPYRPAHLEGAGLVFAATDVAAVNDAVVKDAQARNILVSRADSDDDVPGDFSAVARFEKGPVTVAVSAGSAALSVMIRDAIDAQWDSRWDALAEAMVELRPAIKERFDEPTRRQIFRALASAKALDLLADGGVARLRGWIDEQFGQAAGARA